MRYKFISAYQLIGITRPTDGEDQILAEYPSIGAKAWITYDLDDPLCESDRGSAAGFLILKKFLGQEGEGDFEEEVIRELANFREKRKKDVENGVFVVFEAIGDVESFSPKNGREFFDYMVSIGAPEGAVPKKQIKEKYQAKINELLASLAISSDQVYGIKKLKDDVLFINDQGKYVYSFKIISDSKVTFSAPLQNGIIDFAKDAVKSFNKHKELLGSARLLVKSLAEENDELLSFISIWSGLEILINKLFKIYEKSIFGDLSQVENLSISSELLQRIRTVMKDKYGLGDKFSLVCYELSRDSAIEDIDKFKQIKGIRDKLLHGQEVNISSLPIKDLRYLVRKYLKLHMKAKSIKQRA